MSTYVSSFQDLRSATGRIESRLLLNALADPLDVASRLPAGVRPHVGADGGTVVGCCLLEVADLRPQWLPEIVGLRVRAVAHRISAEWDTAEGETEIGVFVPMRYTDSRLATLLGGRWFPGVHERAKIELVRTPTSLAWTIESSERGDGPRLDVRVDTATSIPDPSPEVCRTCVEPTVGLSPDHHAQLEAAHMVPDNLIARPVHIEHLRSAFLDSFTGAVPAPAYLMEDLGVSWSTGSAELDDVSERAA